MIIEDLIKKILKEATGDSTGGRGSYAPPLQVGIRDFDKTKLAPFTDSLTNYKSPLVAYDSYDHDWDLTQNQRQRLEKTAKKISNFIKKHPESTNSDEDGNILNRTPSGKEKKSRYNKEIVPIKEANTSISAGEYTGPIELGLKKWKNNILAPFTEFVDTKFNHQKKQKTVKNNIKKTVGVWEKNSDGTYKQDEYDVHTLTEDLAVWFGEKKKPKGSSQPKGPWVDICRKVDGKHPPCGRSDASKGSYPKCRASGVAGKMSDSEKRNACQQKRRAEKNDPQSGKGQKPVMVSNNKTTNENMKRKIITLTENDITRIVRRVLNEDTNKTEGIGRLDLKCVNYLNGSKKEYLDYTFFSESETGKFSIKKIKNSAIPDDGIQERTSELLYLTISQPNQKIMQFINSRFPNFYWDEALKYIIYLSTTATPQYFCKAMQEGVDPGGHTSEEWITFFENSSVAYNLPDSIF
jgi:hypothetical protein